ncbi:MAG TPA: sigma-54 dependent transcriptional regulator [Desulfobacteraceae bacterium]|nr:sigma-54 dependent transcriptional regulator [Desulfobacteraceae bacterium]HPJ68049.1 sigma-54 dependent transcriptional regulator [Desulfobacteraceae bacterium]HPQ28390.1 sigma-54 dependent transcriptional regulator [Desulfobacteraceae bacterium]
MNKKKILVVDDRINTLRVLMAILADEGYEVVQAVSGNVAMDVFKDQEDIDAVLADLKMPGMDGLELYHKMKELREPPPFIIMTAYGTVKSAVQALKEGVTNYLIKPLDFDELIIVLNKCIQDYNISRELACLRRQIKEDISFHDIIGTSKKMKEIFDMVETVGPTDASVLIHGETGTGKELLARAIHLESQRKDEKLVYINVAALTESLLEAELFGYVKGAFTGAIGDKIGRLETADHGTLFLDEIGHMSLTFQAKLLRFLQEMTFEPVGSTESRSVNVRLITATNLDLLNEIKAGRFLSDLLYRIEVISIHLPPLRERRDDIPLLVNHFVKKYTGQYEKTVDGLSKEAMETLVKYNWPGNVRELKNCLARAVILSKGTTIGIEDLPKRFLNKPSSSSLSEREGIIPNSSGQGIKIRDMEIELISQTLQQCHGNKSLAARYLGISRKSLYEKMERYRISDVNK